MTLLNSLTEQGRLWTARNWQETRISAVDAGITAAANCACYYPHWQNSALRINAGSSG
ncbi:MAG: hypothetical protein P8X79_21380 [Reinekea sp.]